MQALRNSIYLIVAVASIGLAACQPPDRSTEAPGFGIQITRLSSQWLDDSTASIRPADANPTLQQASQLPSRPVQ